MDTNPIKNEENLFQSLDQTYTKVSKSLVDKPKYFIPWKRAELNRSLVKRGTEVHINPLPFDITHEEMYNVLKIYGEIIDIRIIPRKEKSTCFAFVRFLDKEASDSLLKEKSIKFRVMFISNTIF